MPDPNDRPALIIGDVSPRWRHVEINGTKHKAWENPPAFPGQPRPRKRSVAIEYAAARQVWRTALAVAQKAAYDEALAQGLKEEEAVAVAASAGDSRAYNHFLDSALHILIPDLDLDTIDSIEDDWAADLIVQLGWLEAPNGWESLILPGRGAPSMVPVGPPPVTDPNGSAATAGSGTPSPRRPASRRSAESTATSSGR